MVVVGAGAAGILAAYRAAQCGAKVLVLEKTVRIGTKILVSGGGKCNLTHDGPLEDVLKAFRPQEARFLRPSFYRYTNRDFIEWITGYGLEVYTRPDGRIFPVHQNAKDVVAILRQALDEAGVEIRFDTPVNGIKVEDGAVVAVRTPEGEIEATQLVVSVGGSSFPNSGTTGDGWAWMRDLGHSIVPLRAALAPMYLELKEAPPSGVALRDVVLKVRAGGKERDRWRGDLLYTHQGISGPCALGVSRVVAEAMLEHDVHAWVDFCPDVKFEALLERWTSASHQSPHRKVQTELEEIMPERIARKVLADFQIDPESKLKDLDRKSRNRLVEGLKAWDLGAVRAVPLEKGEVVAGGVALDEVDPHTMQSRKVQGLYLCGEILDVAGPVGGYNLQAAWSTGFVAGESAATLVQELNA